MNIIFFVGAAIFGISSVFFLLQSKKEFKTAFLVSIITLISYLVMYTNLLVATTDTGEAIYWTRWIFYAMSCTLLVYQMSLLLKKSKDQRTQLLYLTVLVMGSGALAAITSGGIALLFFLISTAVYILLAWNLITSKSSHSPMIRPYILGGWSIFPVVFLLSPEGLNLIANDIAIILYLALDIFTKIIFYVHMSLAEQPSKQQ